MTSIISFEQRKLPSVKIQILATIVSVIAAVLLPQFFHWLGIVSGAGKNPGVAFSPMHPPVMLVGFLAGGYAGGIGGLLAPVVAHFFSGMPNAMQLPFMMIELFGYGLGAGLLRNVKFSLIVKVLAVQIFGRLLRMFACIFAFYVLGNEKMTVLSIWQSIPRVLPGILLQLVFIPLIVYWVENRERK